MGSIKATACKIPQIFFYLKYKVSHIQHESLCFISYGLWPSSGFPLHFFKQILSHIQYYCIIVAGRKKFHKKSISLFEKYYKYISLFEKYYTSISLFENYYKFYLCLVRNVGVDRDSKLSRGFYLLSNGSGGN